MCSENVLVKPIFIPTQTVDNITLSDVETDVGSVVYENAVLLWNTRCINLDHAVIDKIVNIVFSMMSAFESYEEYYTEMQAVVSNHIDEDGFLIFPEVDDSVGEEEEEKDEYTYMDEYKEGFLEGHTAMCEYEDEYAYEYEIDDDEYYDEEYVAKSMIASC